MNLNNIIMFTGANCHGCKIMKKLFDEKDIKLKEIVDTSTDSGMHLAMNYKIRSLPTFINIETKNMLTGTISLKQLQDLN